MRSASVKEIKEALQSIEHDQLQEICLRLARFKLENKELLTYLLFEAEDENNYLNNVKDSLLNLFNDVNTGNLYYAKKTIRKILRQANKFIRYSGNDITEVEVLLFVAAEINSLKLNLSKSQALLNLYNGILKKAEKKILTLHEDLQYDFLREFEKLK